MKIKFRGPPKPPKYSYFDRTMGKKWSTFAVEHQASKLSANTTLMSYGDGRKQSVHYFRR